MKPAEQRAQSAYDLLGALIVAFLLALPFAIYFWSMKP